MIYIRRLQLMIFKMTENTLKEPDTVKIGEKNPECAVPNETTKEDVVESFIKKKLNETEGTFAIFESKCADAFNVLEKSYKDLRTEMKELEKAKKKLDDVHFLDVVTLNVGGEKFETGLQTLKKYPKSLFAMMFSSTLKLKTNQDKTHFIDRDGSLFRYLINFMRTGKVTARMKELAEELIEEAKFFGLPGLIDALSENDGKDGDKESLLTNQQSPEVTIVDVTEQISTVNELFTEAKSSLVRAKVAANDNFSFLEEKQKTFLEMAKRLKDVHFSEIVRINVGGKFFETSISTLQKDPNSMLAAMFSGRFEVVKQKDGAYFIDRDGTHFRHILNFLRMGRIARGVIKEIGEELEEEAEFYNLQPLVEAIAKLTPVRINNDGEVLTTTMSILRRHGFGDSFFSLVQEVPQIDGIFIISPQLKHLAEVIQFLKNGELSKDQLQKIKVELYNTAIVLDFKYLKSCLTDITGSKILDGHREYINLLKIWLKEKKDSVLPCLIYSADEQGWEHKDFAKHCFGKGPTLVLIESEFGWDANCFLFSLKSMEWDEPFMMQAINGRGGILCHNSLPRFVNASISSSQLQLENQPNRQKSSYIDRSAFTLLEGVPQTNSLLTGHERFLTNKLEVFAI